MVSFTWRKWNIFFVTIKTGNDLSLIQLNLSESNINIFFVNNARLKKKIYKGSLYLLRFNHKMRIKVFLSMNCHCRRHIYHKNSSTEMNFKNRFFVYSTLGHFGDSFTSFSQDGRVFLSLHDLEVDLKKNYTTFRDHRTKSLHYGKRWPVGNSTGRQFLKRKQLPTRQATTTTCQKCYLFVSEFQNLNTLNKKKHLQIHENSFLYIHINVFWPSSLCYLIFEIKLVSKYHFKNHSRCFKKPNKIL